MAKFKKRFVGQECQRTRVIMLDHYIANKGAFTQRARLAQIKILTCKKYFVKYDIEKLGVYSTIASLNGTINLPPHETELQKSHGCAGITREEGLQKWAVNEEGFMSTHYIMYPKH